MMLTSMPLIQRAFQRLHYPVDIIAQCVRRYLAYALNLRNIEEMMAERGITFDHSTLHRWVIRLTPLLDKALRWHKHSMERRCNMCETYIKIKDQWRYLYRADDTNGPAIDFLLTAKRDAAAALRFFRNAIRKNGESDDEAIIVRQSKNLNNLVAQDHRNIKQRIRTMLGFKSFRMKSIKSQS